MQDSVDFNCPLPLHQTEQILMGHGGGGKLMQQLIEGLFLPSFNNSLLNQRHDSTVINLGDVRIAFTTDSYVIQPLFFPGGDIGSLAVNGTVNDLAMAGSRPCYLSVGLIIEEGFPIATLENIIQSMQAAADKAKVQIVTGDTKVIDKVVDRNHDQGHSGSSLFINTTGIGIVEHSATIAPRSIQVGDVLLLNGDLGRHGMAIMALREGLQFDSPIESDCAPLAEPILALLDQGIPLHCLRDLTRGGLASATIELAEAANVEIELTDAAIPVHEAVRGACEILGLDPIYVANEGRFIAFVPPDTVEVTLSILNQYFPQQACVIGHVRSKAPNLDRGYVTIRNSLGVKRILTQLSGDPLPRIC
ncbi:hydrogenase expression/formation protein HypE [Alkalinema pantanalense CENA528]|uniref:hydrogenase expression/formation protein HypE n=1 Tax=Alkalinema pantanalense TaxID=1620705 RepID=UPI003D701A14